MVSAVIHAALVVIGSLIAFCFAESAQPEVAPPPKLRCEYRTNPVGIDCLIPRLSWQMSDPRVGAAQRAYHVLAADDEEQLAADHGNL